MKTTTTVKILIADDDSDDLDFLKFLFEQHENFEVLQSVSSASQVIELIKSGVVPDVLLTDFYMPIMTGAELTQYFLDHKIIPDTSIFIISTVINETQKELFSPNPKIHFLVKPVNLTEINNIPGIILEKMGRENPKRV